MLAFSVHDNNSKIFSNFLSYLRNFDSRFFFKIYIEKGDFYTGYK